MIDFAASTNHSLSAQPDIVHEHSRREVELFRGKAFEIAPGRLAGAFQGPAQALRAGLAILESAQRLGAVIRLVVHTGECEMREKSIEGPVVDASLALISIAEPGLLTATGTVKDLVAGAELEFSPHPGPTNVASITRLFYVSQ